MSSQNIPLQGRIDLCGSSRIPATRLFAFKLRRWEAQLGPSARISAGCLRWQELPRDFLPIPFRLPASVALPPLESEKPTASPQRSPETQIDHRPDGLRRRPPCCFSVASWSLRTRRHGVISDFEWTFVHFCSCLPSMQIMTRPLARFAPSA